MAQAVLLYHSRQVFFGFLLPDDILKRHGAKIGVKNKPFAVVANGLKIFQSGNDFNRGLKTGYPGLV